MTPEKVASMDPIMLMSIVNMKIRDEFGDLHCFVKFYELDQDALIKRLADAGFDYLEEAKQFR
ncbi:MULTISPECIES: DUF4250 domain-containing protein [Aliivibrio]|jgi:hypothetical protein|uniref:DUF4250 domain-containing protein n=3 Tax=Aliivibrio TaxID=511678 RepID=A0A1B9NYJ9_ALILO|nr:MULTISPECIES: DUF4250 domain-containing protein [Aliivibrio]AZL84160.1 DUF4250 domain-containing protein [Aliivibrio salmonicida]MBB1312723.1 DUF4250 domain-containing protein [Aliivibrio sp. SR45-2]OCH20885.1 hypothetical protein A6E04_13960 [Aliivibrio logei]OEF09933.1 hypothetical protein A1Q5_02090 [Aliivibrio logei 5S-186]CAQ78586.1 hypothetical protein VSAL_I0901 [Aliivibrio salmonicida LFI1238]